jgi:hypothetical protein
VCPQLEASSEAELWFVDHRRVSVALGFRFHDRSFGLLGAAGPQLASFADHRMARRQCGDRAAAASTRQSPPYIITRPQIDLVAEVLDATLTEIEATL